jgi:hypothetical protein
MNNYSYLFEVDTPSPIQLLEVQMSTLADLWDCRDEDKCFDLKQFVDILKLDIGEEIQDIWLPIFRNTKNIRQALCVLKDGYDETILSDLCIFYMSVLESEDENK